MKRILSLLFVVLFFACNQFQTKKHTSEEILSRERRELNWHEVDQYPAFKDCREVTEVKAAKTCFENNVARTVYAHLEQKRLVVTQALNDTVWIHLIISEKGIPALDAVEMDSVMRKQLPKIKLWLKESIDSLPKIYPAIKRGIPVATKFKMPIVIKTE